MQYSLIKQKIIAKPLGFFFTLLFPSICFFSKHTIKHFFFLLVLKKEEEEEEVKDKKKTASICSELFDISL